jgi:T5SS/PEP-CTERM-associated repeat protein
MRWLLATRPAVSERSWGALMALVVAICLAGGTSTADAAITATGSVEPANPATWTTATTGLIGRTANGTLTINAGSNLLSNNCYVGYSRSVTGVATVDGNGSTWVNGTSILVGYDSSGTVNVTNGGTVSTGTREILMETARSI